MGQTQGVVFSYYLELSSTRLVAIQNKANELYLAILFIARSEVAREMGQVRCRKASWGLFLGDAVSKMADENTKVQLVESDIPGAELPKPAEFCTVAILKRCSQKVILPFESVVCVTHANEEG